MEQLDPVRRKVREEWAARVTSYADRAASQTARLAEILVGAVAPSPGTSVLDVATGPGVAAVEAAKAVGPGGRVLATDLVAAWAGAVAARAEAAGTRNVEFREMAAEDLDLPDAAFDTVLCQLGLMLMPDPARALREMRRVLKPGGRLGIAVWSTADRVPIFGVPAKVLGRFMPTPAADAPPGPLSLAEPGLVDGHVATVGFSHVSVDRRAVPFQVGEPDDLWRQHTDQGPPALRAALAALDAAEREQLRRQFTAELELHRVGGEIVLLNEAIIVTAAG